MICGQPGDSWMPDNPANAETTEMRMKLWGEVGPALANLPETQKTNYVTKDSGAREAFKSGAVRDTREGKGRFDLIPPGPMARLAGVYERGATKYSDNNWKQGIPLSRCMDSCLRHLNQFKAGARDEDHLAHAAWNIFSMMWYEGTENDDSERLK